MCRDRVIGSQLSTVHTLSSSQSSSTQTSCVNNNLPDDTPCDDPCVGVCQAGICVPR